MKSARRRWDWPSAWLLLLAVLIAGWRLGATGWTSDLFRLQLLFVFGTIFGLMLGTSRFQPPTARIFLVLYGSFFLPWQLGLTLGYGVEWNERLQSLWGRFWSSTGQVLRQENVEDPLLFWVLMGALLWGLGGHAGFRLARWGQAWRAMLPIGLMMVFVHTYDAVQDFRIWHLAAFVGVMLLIVARSHLLAQRENWGAKGTKLPSNQGTDLFSAASLAVGLLILMAWLAPAISSSENPARSAWETVTRPWRLVRQQFGRPFSSLERVGGIRVYNYYATELALGSGIPVEGDIVMVAEVSGESFFPARFYWRDRVYDHYESNGWQSSFSNEARVEAGERGLQGEDVGSGENESRIQITTGHNISVLHSPPNPASVSRAADVSFAENPDGSWDVSAVVSPTVIFTGESYAVESPITNVAISQLREAGSDYPGWVLERYLQLPENVSERTLQLGQELAEGHSNPYDIAVAVTEWLRENITYVNSIELPRGEFDAIDWVLFEQQEAFCNYYATAEIILLRSVGIPARLAVGYAQGEADDRNLLLESGLEEDEQGALEISDSIFYTVRQYDAHAWPEIYFPGYGWVEFEPTVNQEPLVRPADEESAALGALLLPPISFEEEAIQPEALEPETELPPQAEPPSGFLGTQRKLYISLVSIAILAGVFVGWRGYRRRGGRSVPALLESGLERMAIQPPEGLLRWANYSMLPPLQRAFMEVNSALRRIGAAPLAGDTPKERAMALSARIPRIRGSVSALHKQYEKALYNEERGNAEGVERAKWAIRAASIAEQIKLMGRNLGQLPRKWRQGMNW